MTPQFYDSVNRADYILDGVKATFDTVNSKKLWLHGNGPFVVPVTWVYETLYANVPVLMIHKELMEPGVYRVHYVSKLWDYQVVGGYAAYDKHGHLMVCVNIQEAVALHRTSAPYRFAKLAGLE